MEQYLSNMNWFDITIISVVLISTIFAMFRGLIKTVFSLFTWIASSAITVFLYKDAHEFLSTKIHNDKVLIAVSSLGVFLAAFIVIAIINAFILYGLRKASGSFFDRLLGFCFGAIRGLLIVLSVFYSINIVSKLLHVGDDPERPGPAWFSKAVTYDALSLGVKMAFEYFPHDMPIKLEDFVTKIKDTTMSSVQGDFSVLGAKVDSKVLSDEERGLMEQITASLNEEEVAAIYKKFDASEKPTEFEKVAMFKELIDLYKEAVKNDKIAPDKIIPDASLINLEEALTKVKDTSSSSPNPDEPGYKDQNLKQMDRLIEGVSQ